MKKNMNMNCSCVDCMATGCAGSGFYPEFCLTEDMSGGSEAPDEVMALYSEDDENSAVARAAAEVEAENYCKLTRIEEIMEFARKLGFKKLGIAFCAGLSSEAQIAAKIFRAKGFEVFGVACKVGAQSKELLNFDMGSLKLDDGKVLGENMCNPILQAKLLNREKTQLNIVMGLCVGHDSLFYKYSDALTTTLITKDRVLAHNPAAALYQAKSYYRRLLEKDEE